MANLYFYILYSDQLLFSYTSSPVPERFFHTFLLRKLLPYSKGTAFRPIDEIGKVANGRGS